MAKDVMMFVLDECPYCAEAFRIMDNLKADHPEFNDVNIEIVEENADPEKIMLYDYEYVPTYFVGGKKVHEGVPSEEAVMQVFKEALTD